MDFDSACVIYPEKKAPKGKLQKHCILRVSKTNSPSIPLFIFVVIPRDSRTRNTIDYVTHAFLSLHNVLTRFTWHSFMLVYLITRDRSFHLFKITS